MQKNKLTIKELRFVEEYVGNSFNGSKAYQISYQTENSNLAKAEAWKMLQKHKIQDAIMLTEKSYKQLAREMRLDRRRILIMLRQVIKGNNAKEKLAGINILCKLTGDFSPKKEEVQIEYESSFDIDISKLSKKELLELRDKILANM